MTQTSAARLGGLSTRGSGSVDCNILVKEEVLARYWLASI